VSAVAQNVVRIAGATAMRSADLSIIDGKTAFIKITGFADDRSRGFVDNLVGSRAESAGARLVQNPEKAQVLLEIAINNAGNDVGASSHVVTSSERTEGVVDLTLTVRDASTGKRLSSQTVRGEAKYEQTSYLGVYRNDGYYYVKTANGFDEIRDPASYR
jgi:hypothetical protein